MPKQSFIRKFLARARNADPTSDEMPIAESVFHTRDGVEAGPSGGAAVKPSITEILFRRSEPPSAKADTEDDAPDVATRAVTTGSSDRNQDKRVSKREETAQKISDGFDNLSGLLSSINDKLETGNERNRALSESIEGLPDVLRSIPEANRAQIEFLGTISKQLDLQSTRSAEVLDKLLGVPEILKSIPRAQQRQAEILENVTTEISANAQQQMKFMRKSEERQSEALQSFNSAQNKGLGLFHKAQQQNIATLRETQKEQGRQLRDLIASQQRSLNRVLITTAVIMGIALVGMAAAMVFLK